MKKITYIILFLSLVSTHSVIAQSVPDCKLKDTRVELLIAEKTRQLEGDEYCQFRRYHAIDDIDGDKKDDFIVMFIVEDVHRNANHYLQFMLVYLSSKPKSKPLEIQVGERGKRSAVKIMRFEKNKIVTEDQVWQDGDALCCPSGSGQSVYQIKDGQLTKTKENGG